MQQMMMHSTFMGSPYHPPAPAASVEAPGTPRGQPGPALPPLTPPAGSDSQTT